MSLVEQIHILLMYARMYVCMYLSKDRYQNLSAKVMYQSPYIYHVKTMLKPSSKTVTNHRITKLLCKECLEYWPFSKIKLTVFF